MQTQPFYTSKVFWTMVASFALNVLPMAGVNVTSPLVQTGIGALLAVLGVVFRWSSDKPLSVSGSPS
jgi:hypothetical protein